MSIYQETQTIMRTRFLSFVALLAALVLPVSVSAQTSLSETTLSAAVTASQNFITVASATGAVAGGGIYVDREFMVIGDGYVSGTRIPVQRRGPAVSHGASVPVYIGPAAAFVSSNRDGSCVAAAEPYTPVINTVTGDIWECNSAVEKWVNLRDLVVVTCRALLAADQIDQSCFTANRPYLVYRVNEVHTTAESTAATLTLTLRKQTGTQAVGSGTALQSGTINLKGTAQTVQTGTMTATEADLILATGDRLGLDYSTTATELAGTTVTIWLYPL